METKGNITNTDQVFGVLSIDPANTGSNLIRQYARLLANRVWPCFIGPTNAVMPIQACLWNRRISYWQPASGTTGNLAPGGSSYSGSGTYTFPSAAATNIYTDTLRGVWATVVTTTNQQVGTTGPDKNWYRGSVAGHGGIFFVCRFGIEAWTAGDRLFVGLAAINTALTTAQPSATLNMLGFGIDAADTAITFMHNDGSGTATKDTIAGQPALAANQGYIAYICCTPNDTVIYYRLDDLNAGTTIIDTSTSTDLPSSTTTMKTAAVMGNAANTLVTAAQIGVAWVYVESDI